MLPDLISDEKLIVNEVYEKYIKHFNKEPVIIGMFWNDVKLLDQNLLNSIKENKEYNEYELLSQEEKELYNKGELVI